MLPLAGPLRNLWYGVLSSYLSFLLYPLSLPLSNITSTAFSLQHTTPLLYSITLHKSDQLRRKGLASATDVRRKDTSIWQPLAAKCAIRALRPAAYGIQGLVPEAIAQPRLCQSMHHERIPPFFWPIGNRGACLQEIVLCQRGGLVKRPVSKSVPFTAPSGRRIAAPAATLGIIT
jgi:hypothetical protein